jgi:tryptophan-rich sensory protein
MTEFKYFYLIIPMVAVYISGAYYPIKENEEKTKELWFRPPGYVFGIIWPILLALIGYSWFNSPNLSIYYWILTFLLSSWALLFSFNKYYAFYNILVTSLLTLYLIVKKSSLLLIPLFLWLCFASVLAFYSI